MILSLAGVTVHATVSTFKKEIPDDDDVQARSTIRPGK